MAAKSKRISFITLQVFVCAMSLAVFLGTEVSFADASKSTCSEWSYSEWLVFRRQAIASYRTEHKITTNDGITFPVWKPQFEASSIQSTLRTCQSNLKKLKLESCFARLLTFSEALSRTGMGFKLPNKEYLTSQPQKIVVLPEELVSNPALKWREIAAKKGWPWADFISRANYSPRLGIFINTPQIDHWLVIVFENKVLDLDPALAPATVVAQLSIDKRNPRSMLVYAREYEVDEKTGMINLDLENQARCPSCHPSILRDFDENSTNDLKMREVLQSFNRKIGQYENLSWYSYDPNDFGPKRGTQAGCTECHNSTDDRGALRADTDIQLIAHKVLSQEMPPGLSEERSSYEEALKRANSVLLDYDIEVQRWLSEIECSNPTNTSR
ncbi:MAG: hypothetical protein AB1540_16700 [Bdellovibrionota bacterium]